MLRVVIIPISGLAERYRIEVGGVLHLGAHLGEEADEYQRAGAAQVTWVEANPHLVERLMAAVQPFGHRVIQATISDADDGEVIFFVASNDGRSSSFLPMQTHIQEHPSVVVTESIRLSTTTVDTLCSRYALGVIDLLTLDLQGAELLALRGAAHTLDAARYVYTEVNVAELYAGCAMLEELDSYLADFTRLETALTPHGWGDAFYVRTDRVPAGVEPRMWVA